jgi:hypothetical protein
MTADDYRRALDRAVEEYQTLTAERARLDARIGQLAQTIGTLTRLCGMVPTVPWGLTDACRMVLRSAGHPLSALEVRAQLEAMGFELSRYTSDLAAIHTVLKRLSGAGEVRFIARAWDKPAYEWAGLTAGVASAPPRTDPPARATPRKTNRRRT